MKKVLILAYDFPPYISVAGQRPFSWFRYLKEYEIEPIIVTRQWNNNYNNELDYVAPSKSKYTEIENKNSGKILKAPYRPNLANKLLLKYGNKKFKYLRKLISAYFEFTQFILPIGPKIEIYKSAKNFLKRNKVDIILASGSPFVLFHYASELSKKFNIPWVADYRDPWAHNIFNERNRVLKFWSTFQEKKIVNEARFVITVSEFVKEQISTLISKKIYVIPNGYDHDIVEKASQIRQTRECLSIGLAGTIYKWNPIESFLSTLNKLIQRNHTIKVNFYGINIESQIEHLIQAKFPMLKEVICFHPKLQYNELIKELAKNNLLLLFNYYYYMGTKIYEYLGLKRKILLCYSNDDEANFLKEKYYKVKESSKISKTLQEDLVKKTNSGYIIENNTELLKILIDLNNEFKKIKKLNIVQKILNFTLY